MLTLDRQQIPDILLQLNMPVEKLHVIGGDLNEFMTLPRIAIVGSRKFSPYGRGVTEKLATELAQKGIIIISGLALGTDSIAHQACLNAGGRTIAVLPCGYGRIYPSTHTNLARSIIDKGGLLITEYEGDYQPHEFNFLERNRIIAALSDAVVVTEAAARSGSLNTANHALQIGKPVFAVPGNITSPLSAGCNNLIKAGAIPVTCVDDILNALNWKDLSKHAKSPRGGTEEENKIIELIVSGIYDGAELLAQSELQAQTFNQALTMLEITGVIRPTGANTWSLA